MWKEIYTYTPEEREFERVVVGAFMNFEESIDITKFVKEYGWDDARLTNLFSDVIWNNPQLFFVSAKNFSYLMMEYSDGELAEYRIIDYQYSIRKEEYSQRKAEIDLVVADAMGKLSGVTDLVEKARRLHDYIVRICEYDEKAAAEIDPSPLARTVYSVLIRHKAVCEGYVMAYRYLLREAGIRSEEVFSDEMNHCWNYVQIGDKWYHVDVTFDDPIFAGKDPKTFPILYDYFLLSDEEITAMGHCGWKIGVPNTIQHR